MPFSACFQHPYASDKNEFARFGTVDVFVTIQADALGALLIWYPQMTLFLQQQDW